MRICVYGASSTRLDPKYIERSKALCKHFASCGHSMVFGGGANGLMGAAARGFTEGGGHIIGVVPHFFNVDGIIYDKCDQLIRTDTMRERKQIMEDKADAFVVLPGGAGTFDEFFEIYTLKQLGRHNKPIILYNVFGYFNKLIEFLDYSVGENFVSPVSLSLFEVADDDDFITNYLASYKCDNLDLSDTKYI